ncbi:hypothetical protein [Kordia sp.]|uniref:hypothetical protein n=1 Tax=Kordia sp. TaxID=1965332 RepID=UPI003D29D7FF
MIKKQLLAIIMLVCLTISCSSDDDTVTMDLITHFDGNLEINSLADLEDPAIQGYKTINGNLIIRNTDDIEDLRAFENLEAINGRLYILNNDNLKSLQGLENITELNLLVIKDNPELISLVGIDNLASISDTLSIENNDSLETLSSLNNLTTIGNQFSLFFNLTLTNLNGLENLQSVPQVLILGNDNLETIDGLDGITFSNHIGISLNESLTDYCSLVQLAQANPTLLFFPELNSYNPTLDDLINNNCSN